MLSMFIAACMLLVSCSNEEEVVPTLSIVNRAVFASMYSDTYRVNIECNTEWTATVDDAAWCSISPVSGNGNDVITVTVEPNPITTERKATITVRTKTLQETATVIQQAALPTLSITPTAINPEASAGTYSINVTSNIAWNTAVEYITEQGWCTVEPASGTGTGVITVSLTQNTNSRRSAIITVKSDNIVRNYTLIQHGVPPLEEGITINGITWATKNVGNFGTFADMSSDFGKYYQFNRRVAYSIANNSVTPKWNTAANQEGVSVWEYINDPSPEGWRMPTTGELINLSESGHHWVTAEESGFSCAGAWFGTNAQNAVADNPGEAVFLPALGIISPDGEHFNNGLYGYYWSKETGGFPGCQSFVFGETYFNNLTNSFLSKESGVLIRSVKE